MIELILEGRIVSGHPMNRRPVTVTDPVTKREMPKMGADGLQVTEIYVAIAVPKKPGETSWTQTSWGQQMYAQAVADWPRGEYGHPTFSWKVADGDSQIPNKVGKKPCDREGWPGNWVVHASTQLAVKCYHLGKYDPMQQIQDPKEVKCGDYGRLFIHVKGNGPSQSPGIYINPTMFSFDRAGEQIISESGPAAADVFGGGASAPSTSAIAPPPAVPAHDIVAGPGGAIAPPPPAPVEVKYLLNGAAYTQAQLVQGGWKPEQIAALPTA